MPRQYLTAEQYTAGIAELTNKDLVHYGDRIVSSSMAIARLSDRYDVEKGEEKRGLDRNILIQKCRRGQLHPMGRYREKVLYFWTHDIDNLAIEENKIKRK